MAEPTAPKINKWPFFVGDLLLLGGAFFVQAQSARPMGLAQLALAIGCVAAGAILGVLPFVLEYQAAVRMCEAGALNDAVAQVRGINKLAEQISGATARWQNAQDAADKTANAAKEIAEKMAAEVKAFTEFMQRMNDGEKNTMRLEVEKLRRGEQEWLQVLVRVLDHVHALHTGAIRSGQPNLIEQLSLFQNACRDAARKVGLVPVTASPAEPFDPERHQVFEGDGKPNPGSLVGDTIATGYTFQGRMLRPVLVRLKDGAVAPEDGGGAAQLPLAGPKGTEAGL